MEFWFSELHSPHVKFDIRVEKQLFSGKSDYQRIDVFESPEFGKFLTLNGSVIFSEQDCFIYNEMVVHVPMAVHPHGVGACYRVMAAYQKNYCNMTISKI